MTASIFQRGTTDTAPLNNGFVGNDGTSAYFPIVFPAATTVGSTIVVFAQVFPNSGTAQVGACLDSTNGGYSQLDLIPNAGPGNSYITSWIFQNAGSIGPGAIGEATGGSTTTLIDSTQAWTTNQWAGSTLINLSGSGSYTVISNTATTLTFATGAAIVANDYYVVGTFIKVRLTGTAVAWAYNFGECIEVGNASTTGTIAHSSQTNTPGSAGTDNISSGAAVCATSGLMLGYCGNVTGNGATPFEPNAGTGFTSVASLFQADNGVPTFRLESKYYASAPGSQAATWSSNGADTFPAFMVFVPDIGGGGSSIIAWLV